MLAHVYQQENLFDWLELPPATVEVVPWRPRALNHEEWPPNYQAVFAWRLKKLDEIRSDPNMLFGAKEYYRTHKAEFIMDWMDTYNPRVVGALRWMPFVFFKRQHEFIEFLEELVREQEGGLVEKARDVGLTWLCVAWSVATWLFEPETSIGWGSRKEDLVDRLGDPDSIFEKMRLALRRLPKEFLPKGFSWKEHATFMKLINPENGSIIAGEAGDNIGRGGRKSIYFKDESAHYPRPELVEAALGDNTNVPIDISSVNGLGNVFHRKRENGVEWSPNHEPIEKGQTRVFIVDWSDHPEKTKEWYDRRRAKWEADGMLHIFKQEVDRDYSGAIANTVIPIEWIRAAIDAHEKIRWVDDKGCKRLGIPEEHLTGGWMAGLDVADGGIDRNALARRQGIVLRHVEEWGERDTGVTARRAVAACRGVGPLQIQYDSVGIGAGVKAEYNRLVEEKWLDDTGIEFIPWNAGAKVMNPYEHVIEGDEESLTNFEYFGNMKAQAWWSLRTKFWRTFQNVTQGIIYPIEDLISLDSKIPLIRQVEKELAQPTVGSNGQLKMIIEKKPDGTKSPNLADAIVIAYWPVDDAGYLLTGNYGSVGKRG